MTLVHNHVISVSGKAQGGDDTMTMTLVISRTSLGYQPWPHLQQKIAKTYVAAHGVHSLGAKNIKNRKEHIATCVTCILPSPIPVRPS